MPVQILHYQVKTISALKILNTSVMNKGCELSRMTQLWRPEALGTFCAKGNAGRFGIVPLILDLDDQCTSTPVMKVN